MSLQATQVGETSRNLGVWLGFVGVVLGLAWPASPPAARGHTPRWPGGQGTGRNPWVDSPPVFLDFLGFLGAFLCLAWPASLQPHVVVRRNGLGGRAQEGIPECGWVPLGLLGFLGAWSGLGRRNGQGTR